MPDTSYQPKVYRKQGGDELVVASGGLITIESGGSVAAAPGASLLDRVALTCDIADAGTAGSSWVVTPFAGTIVSLSAVNHLANTTTKTVYTAKIATVSVTHPAWETAVTAAAGTATTVVPTAANTVTAGAVIEIASDGGSATAAQKTTFTVVILRTS